MDSILGRHRNLIILLGVLFLQALGLAVQVKRAGPDAENTRLIRIWGVGAITPVERGVVWMQNGVGNIWHNYFYLRGVRAENRELKEQIEQMRIEQVRLSDDAAQAHRLQTLLSFKEQFISKTVAAQVIGSSGSDLSRVITIDKGGDAGLKRDMAVITADGIVGKVILVYPSVAQVLLINDQTSGVGVILEKSRLQGVLRGTANGEVVVERVMSDEQVPVGETVLTSGGDQIFPKGLPVGSVARVSSGKDLFLNIKIKPATNLSKLEEVLVVVEKQERQSLADDASRVRAADILAQRLPSVPDKPATDANAPAGTADSSAKPAATPNAGMTAAEKSTETTNTFKAGKNPAGSGSTQKPSIPTVPDSLPAKLAKPAQPQSTPVNSQPPADENRPQ
jgi:rod shape-determining protein MreC